MQSEVDDQMINTKFVDILFRLMEDKVPNIRFSSAKAILLIVPRLTAANQNRAREILEKNAENDEDFDAKFFAQKALDKLTGK